MDANILFLLKRLGDNWKRLVIVACAGLFVGAIIGITTPKEYTVVSKIVPESVSSKSLLGSQAAMAVLSGSVNLMSSSDAVYPEVYPDIISSSPFLVELLSTPVAVVEKKDTIHTNLYDFQLNYRKKSLVSAILSSPFKLANLIFSKKSDVEDETVIDSLDVTRLTKRQDKVVRSVRKSIETDVDKKTMKVTIAVKSQNQMLAADLSQAVIENLNSYLCRYYNAKDFADLEYFEKLTAQSKEEYYSAQSRYAHYLDANQQTILQSRLVTQQRLKSDMDLAGQLYEQMAKKELTARAKLQEEKPVIFVIQPPMIPYKGSPSTSKTAIIFAFFAGVLYAIWVMFFKKEPKNE